MVLMMMMMMLMVMTVMVMMMVMMVMMMVTDDNIIIIRHEIPKNSSIIATKMLNGTGSETLRGGQGASYSCW